MVLKKRNLQTLFLCLGVFLAVVSYLDDIWFNSFGRILYTDDELEQMKKDCGCISRLHRLIYVHVPKTGGSTFQHSELMQDAESDYLLGLREPLGGHIPIAAMKSNAEERGIVDFHTAATIRHPCSRFISAYRFLTSDLCSRADKANREKYGISPNQSVAKYIQYLEKSPWEKIYIHFIPQYIFFLNQNRTRVDIDNILCNEQWDEGIHRLKSVLGIEEMDTRRLYNHRGLGSSSDHIFQNQHEKCQDLKPETREAIERFYAMDYCLFGYDEHTPDEDDICVGTDNNAQSMTKRFHDCKEKLSKAV